MQDSDSLAVFKVTARDQGHYKGPSGAFVTYCNMSCLNLLLPRKQQYLAEIHIFLSVYFLCVGITILKIVLSHAFRWVSSDGHSLEINFSLVMSSPGGLRMVNE